VSFRKRGDGFAQVINSYRSHATRANKKWELTKERCLELFSQECAYCGEEPSNLMPSRHGTFIYSGIDKKDPTKDYTEDNVVTSCALCNRMKSNMQVEEFYAWVERIRATHPSIFNSYPINQGKKP
jgi:hypothetical protein